MFENYISFDRNDTFFLFFLFYVMVKKKKNASHIIARDRSCSRVYEN